MRDGASVLRSRPAHHDEDLGRDATELFNFLTTGYTPERKYRKLLHRRAC